MGTEKIISPIRLTTRSIGRAKECTKHHFGGERETKPHGFSFVNRATWFGLAMPQKHKYECNTREEFVEYRNEEELVLQEAKLWCYFVLSLKKMVRPKSEAIGPY